MYGQIRRCWVEEAEGLTDSQTISGNIPMIEVKERVKRDGGTEDRGNG